MKYGSLYFNEHDPFAAQWLRNLWPEAHVDERDIQDVKPADVMGFERCHFFGGIGGWEYALDLAGFVGPVWTGSCPCQPFSSAGKRQGEADERHLWPAFRGIIAECRPATIFGEQVASDDGCEWLDRVRADLEAMGYAVGAADLCAASQAAPHPRQRFFWVAYAGGSRADILAEKMRPRHSTTGQSGNACGLGISNGDGSQSGAPAATTARHRDSTIAAGSAIDGMGNTDRSELALDRKQSARQEREATTGASRIIEGLELSAVIRSRGQRLEDGWSPETTWSSSAVVQRGKDYCRISAQPGDEPLAYGIPRDLGRRFPELRQLAKGARANRVGRLKGYGNSIVPQVAATFIRAAMEATEGGLPPAEQ